MLEYVDAIYRALGIKSTWQFVLLIAIAFGFIGAIGGGLAALIVDLRYKNSPEYKAENANPKLEAVAHQTAQNAAAIQPQAPTPSVPLPKKTQTEKKGTDSVSAITSGPHSPAVGTITQGPNSIAQVGDNNQAIQINQAPPPPHVNWSQESLEPNSDPMKPYAGWSLGASQEILKDKAMRAQFMKNPGAFVTMSPENAWAEFAAFCDRPCESIAAQYVSGSVSAIGQTAHGSTGDGKIVGIQCVEPSLIPSGGVVKWEIRSLDKQSIKISDVRAVHIKIQSMAP